MDVAAIEVGTDFVDQVERAIAESDASLVVIGPDWLRLEDEHGGRRLDDPNDHVRSEVRSALGSNHPVVPVLVDGASLPSEEELPADLAPLARRQAVELSDETWAEDVEMLIRRLEGKDLARPPRRLLLPVGVGLVALVVLAVVLWQGVADPAGDGEVTGCPDPDETWASVEVGAQATNLQQLDGDRALRYTVIAGVFSTEEDTEWLVLLQVRLHNESEDIPNTNDDHTRYGVSLFDALHVDHVSVGSPYCFDEGVDPDLSPDEAAIVRVGFESPLDPTGAPLLLVTDGPLQIEITSGA